ncbi:MAG TPA: hypothetical protein VMV46_16690 [Thermoanaerobaculia bacterium]|nr:hypothetical protein [Thermoanaerobaculia bacterium]
MRSPKRRVRAFVDAAVALTAIWMLLSSALLAAGAHEHLTPSRLEVVCSDDHGARAAAGSLSGVHGAERPHRHHCASCQLAAKGAVQRPAASALVGRPSEPDRLVPSAAPTVRTAHDAAAPPRGPPIF